MSPTLYLTDIITILIIFSYFFIIKKRNFDFRTLLFLAPFSLGFLVAYNFYAFLYGFMKLLEFIFLGLIIVDKFSITNKVLSVLSFTVIFESILVIAQFLNHGSLGSFLYFLGERTFTSQTPGIANASIAGQLILRPYATFSHPNVLAGYLVIIMSLLFIAGSNKIKKKEILLRTIAITSGSIALLLTLSRVAIFVWLIILTIELLRKLNKNKFIILSLFLILIITIWFVLFSSFSKRFSLSDLGNESTVQRVYFIDNSIKIIAANPIFGVGLNNYFYYSPSNSKNNILPIQPVHNIYLLILTQSGVLGFGAFLYLVLKTFKKISLFKNKQKKMVFYYTFFALLFLGLFDHYLLTIQQGQLLLTTVFAFYWSKN